MSKRTLNCHSLDFLIREFGRVGTAHRLGIEVGHLPDLVTGEKIAPNQGLLCLAEWLRLRANEFLIIADEVEGLRTDQDNSEFRIRIVRNDAAARHKEAR